MEPHLITGQFSLGKLEGSLEFLLVSRIEDSLMVGSPFSARCSARRREEARLWSKKNAAEKIGNTGEATGGRFLSGAETHHYGV